MGLLDSFRKRSEVPQDISAEAGMGIPRKNFEGTSGSEKAEDPVKAAMATIQDGSGIPNTQVSSVGVQQRPIDEVPLPRVIKMPTISSYIGKEAGIQNRHGIPPIANDNNPINPIVKKESDELEIVSTPKTAETPHGATPIGSIGEKGIQPDMDKIESKKPESPLMSLEKIQKTMEAIHAKEGEKGDIKKGVAHENTTPTYIKDVVQEVNADGVVGDERGDGTFITTQVQPKVPEASTPISKVYGVVLPARAAQGATTESPQGDQKDNVYLQEAQRKRNERSEGKEPQAEASVLEGKIKDIIVRMNGEKPEVVAHKIAEVVNNAQREHHGELVENLKSAVNSATH